MTLNSKETAAWFVMRKPPCQEVATDENPGTTMRALPETQWLQKTWAPPYCHLSHFTQVHATGRTLITSRTLGAKAPSK